MQVVPAQPAIHLVHLTLESYPGNFKYILKKYQPTLAENISLPDLIPHLNQHNLLSDEENDVLLDSKLTHKERILKLLSFIEKKNTILYINFLQALEEETNHPGHKMLADMLRRATGNCFCTTA